MGINRKIAVDIDETICDTRRHWFSKLSDLFDKPEDLDIDSLITRYRYTSAVHLWQTEEALHWLREARFDPEIHRRDLPVVPGAVAGVETLRERFDVIYMTMRPDCIVDATREWLKHHNFPVGEVLASPSSLADNERARWKGRELFSRFPDIVGIVDDHPDVANSIPAGYRGKVFLLGHDSIERSDISIICCPHWKDVQPAVERALPRQLPR